MTHDLDLSPDEVIRRARERRHLAQRRPERPIMAAVAAADARDRRAAAQRFLTLCGLMLAAPDEPEALQRLAAAQGDERVSAIVQRAGAAQIGTLPATQAAAAAWLESVASLGLFDAIAANGATRLPWIARTGDLAGIAALQVGEGKAKPIGQLGLTVGALAQHKFAVLLILSRELFRQPDLPVALIDVEMAKALAAATDTQIVSDITSGLTPIGSTGDPVEDVHAALAATTRAGGPLVWGMGTATHDQFLALASEKVPQALRSGVIVRSDAIDSDSLLVVDASQCHLSDLGLVPSRATHADVSFAAAGAADSPPADLVSLWQTNSVGLRLERSVKFALKRTEAAALVNGISWVGGSP